jgi:putative heme-binding domain-containing protein
MRSISIWLLFLLSPLAILAQDPPTLALRDGDRVAFIGDTLIEREQYSGWIELLLTARFADRNVIFRNLGWSADTPAGDSRFGLSLLQAGLEPPDEGWKQLQKQIAEYKPTVAVLGYGMASSFAGDAGLPKFKADYARLLAHLKSVVPEVRFLFLSPITHEWLEGYPNPAEHNRQLLAYGRAIEDVARKERSLFVNLSGGWTNLDVPAKKGITENGIHLKEAGYAWIAGEIEKALGLSDPIKSRMSQGIPGYPDVLAVILRKNEFFFHRSRPANMAYIFGFRKREQGQNAVEMPQFDPMIAAEEKKIRELCQHLSEPNFRPGPALQPAPLRSESAVAKFVPQKHPDFILGDGLEVTLWAENPQLKKPIQMNFDPKGRLWVASSEVYPHIEPGQAATDKIIVLEDTDGDGKADKSTVFAEGLLIPTGVEPGDGGCYVAQSTELLHFKDTNGDGKADERRIVLSGFGTEDTHHNLHTLRWGPDGRLWMNQSIYTRTDTETPQGVLRHKSGAVMALRPDTLEFEVVFKGWCNPWGHAFDQYGQSFITDGAGFQGISWAVPGATYFTYAKMRREMKSISPGNYPKFASLDIIESDMFPREWQGSFVTCDFRANRVTRFSVSEAGAGYVTKQEADLLRTTTSTFRPIDVKLGPDGAIYIADWSNPIIQHGEVDFRDPRRDRTHGRIWRVAWKGGPAAKARDFTKATTEELLNEQLSPNGFNRAQARRVLLERPDDAVAEALPGWSARHQEDLATLAAIRLAQRINHPEAAPDLDRIMESKNPSIRAAAMRVFAQDLDVAVKRAAQAPAGAALLRNTVTASGAFARGVMDEHPRVRLETIRAFAKVPLAESASLALRVVDQPLDPFLDYAAWLTINDLATPFLRALEAGEWKPETAAQEKQLEFALSAVEPNLASGYLAKRLAAEPIPRDGSGPWLRLVGQAGGPAELRRLYDQVLNNGFEDPAAGQALAALDNAARTRSTRPTGTLTGLERLVASANDRVRVPAIRLTGAWRDTGPAFREVTQLASAATTPGPVRDAAFASVRDIGGGQAVNTLVPLTAKTSPASIRRPAVLTLASVNLSKALPPSVELLNDAASESDALALWRELLKIKGAAPALAKALPKSGFSQTAAKAGLRAAREGGRNEPDLILALTLSAGLDQGEVTLSETELKQLAADVKKGDPARGETLYRRADLNCVACHAIGGAGGKVGPDMTSIGASAPVDYLIESVWFPNKKIKEGYHAVSVETKDGEQFSGILVRENGETLVLRDATNNEKEMAKSRLSDRRMGTLSLMPAGLIDNLNGQERLDLFRFLSELGKPGPYDATKGTVARAWRVRAGLHTDEQFGLDQIVSGDLTGKGWNLVYANVDGALPGERMRDGATAGFYVGIVGILAGAQLQVTKPGPVTFRLRNADGAQVWVNGTPAAGAGEFKADLPAGTARIVVKLDPKKLPETLRLEASDGVFVTN